MGSSARGEARSPRDDVDDEVGHAEEEITRPEEGDPPGHGVRLVRVIVLTRLLIGSHVRALAFLSTDANRPRSMASSSSSMRYFGRSISRKCPAHRPQSVRKSSGAMPAKYTASATTPKPEISSLTIVMPNSVIL